MVGTDTTVGTGGTGGAGATNSSGGATDACASASYGATQDAQSFSAFMIAAGSFARAAGDIDSTLVSVCRGLGTDLGMTDAEINANGTDTRAQCTAVNGKLQSEIAAIRAARLTTRVERTEPVCKTRVQEYRACIQRCEPRVVEQGRVEYQCQGGEMRGSCGASCSGRCAVEVNGQCGGACEGTCSGSCTGQCNGICEGTCSSRDAQGNCTGTCQGTCRGRCSAGCTGSCQGRCELSGQASCSGECRGGCSVEYQAPVCTGRIVPPEVRTECRESCDSTQIEYRECTPGQTRIVVDGTAAADAMARSQRVQTAVSARVPQITAIGARVADLGQAGEALVRNGAGFARSAFSLGAAAAVCSAQAVAALPIAVARVNVAVSVSVSVQGSVNTARN